jgi:hypothetical protein
MVKSAHGVALARKREQPGRGELRSARRWAGARGGRGRWRVARGRRVAGGRRLGVSGRWVSRRIGAVGGGRGGRGGLCGGVAASARSDDEQRKGQQGGRSESAHAGIGARTVGGEKTGRRGRATVRRNSDALRARRFGPSTGGLAGRCLALEDAAPTARTRVAEAGVARVHAAHLRLPVAFARRDRFAPPARPRDAAGVRRAFVAHADVLAVLREHLGGRRHSAAVPGLAEGVGARGHRARLRRTRRCVIARARGRLRLLRPLTGEADAAQSRDERERGCTWHHARETCTGSRRGRVDAPLA